MLVLEFIWTLFLLICVIVIILRLGCVLWTLRSVSVTALNMSSISVCISDIIPIPSSLQWCLVNNIGGVISSSIISIFVVTL